MFIRGNLWLKLFRALERHPVPLPWPPYFHPQVEILEDRTAPAIISAGDVSGLIAAINEANSQTGIYAGSNTINLTGGSTYCVTTVDNYWYGPNGLPAISSNITVNGNGETIKRSSVSGTPDFRLFYVSGGLSGLAAGNLTLNDVTLSGGVALGGSSNGGGGGLVAGGAIFNQGTLTLMDSTITGDKAIGGSGGDSSYGNGGGGIGRNALGNNNNGGGFGGLFPGARSAATAAMAKMVQVVEVAASAQRSQAIMRHRARPELEGGCTASAVWEVVTRLRVFTVVR